MPKIITMEDYIKALEGRRVGVSIKSYSKDILGTLESLTYDGDVFTGIIIEKWGWIEKSEIRRINEAKNRREGVEGVAQEVG